MEYVSTTGIPCHVFQAETVWGKTDQNLQVCNVGVWGWGGPGRMKSIWQDYAGESS